MSEGPPVFEPVDEDEIDRETGSKPEVDAVASKEQEPSDRYPLAGPILEKARTFKLKGRCSSCDSLLRLELDEDPPVRVRCPLCGHVGRVDPR